ncbi:hypothetical protein BH10BAC1_BH10BAC1_19310 [soil metagenome]
MKKQLILTTACSILFTLVAVKADAQKAAKPGPFANLNDVKDELGVSGEYNSLNDKKPYGLKFTKEVDGKIVNELQYFEKKGSTPAGTLTLKENYYDKYKVKMFYTVISNTYVELLELEPGVFAQITSNYNNNGNAVPPDAERKVLDVLAKNKSSFDTWSVDVAQAKVEMMMVPLNEEKILKTKATLMTFDAYKNYKGKIAFGKETNIFRNDHENQPKEKLEWFITKAELGNTLAFKPYFDDMFSAKYPGAWFNITYELAGEKTDREVLRKSNSFFSSNIPVMKKGNMDDFYFFNARSPINNNGSADYAYLELLRKIKDKVKEGQSYELKVTVWAFKDGENIAAIATGSIQLEYTKGENGTKKLLFDPASGWIPKMEKWINE